MDISEKLENLSLTFMMASLNPDDSELFDGEDFVTKVLQKKFTVFNLPIKVPNWLGFLIGYCVNGNPGYCQIIMDEVLQSVNERKFSNMGIDDDYVITPTDFALCYPFQFPLLDIPDVEKRISDKYDEIKNSQYTFDTIHFWNRHFKSRMGENYRGN